MYSHIPNEHLPIYGLSKETTHPAGTEERVSAVLARPPFSMFLFSLFLSVSLTLSPYVVLCISQMNQTG